MSRPRQRSSSSSMNSRPSATSGSSSSPTTFRSSQPSPTRSWSCATGRSWKPASSTACSRGGRLRFGFGGATTADTLDPHHVASDFSYGMAVQMHAPLLRYSDDGVSKPGLGEEFHVESPTSLLVRLKQGAEFHNGKTV